MASTFLSSLSPETIDTLVRLSQEADVTRYLSVAGLIVLLYDHVLSLPDEIALIWGAVPSFAKYVFLFNRYLVPGTLMAVAYEMCGFTGHVFSDEWYVPISRFENLLMGITPRCQRFLSTVSMFAVCSLGIANVLVLLRVVLLWDRQRTATWLIAGGFLASFCATLTSMFVTLVKLVHGIIYSPVARMCVTTTTTKTFIAVWSLPMIFEIVVLISTCWNAFDRPRPAHIRLTRALHRDGITFFLALTILRSVNIAFAALSRPELSLVPVFFVWSMTTLVLNRSLLSLQRAETLDALTAATGHSVDIRAASPFGVHALSEYDSDDQFELDDMYNIYGGKRAISSLS